MKNLIIIVAGGRGKRFDSERPKQFLPLGKQLVLMHTINAFYQFDSKATIRVVLPQDYIQDWKTWCKDYHFNTVHQCIAGGTERFYSVKNALLNTDDFDYVMVHDGARPMVSQTCIQNSLEGAQKYGAAIPCIPLTDSLRKLESPGTFNQNSQSINRSEYVAIQTPQVFQFEWFKEAYTQDFDVLFTDDASVVERLNHPVQLVEGDINNIKITVARDLQWCELLINHN